MIKAVIFDFNRTLYDPDSKGIEKETRGMLYCLKDSRIKLGLISVNSRKMLIDDLGLPIIFSFILFTDEKTKEDFENAMEQLKASKEETIVVGDEIKSEIKAANKAGIRTVWLRKGKFADEFPDSIEEEPDYVIEEISDIIQIINSID